MTEALRSPWLVAVWPGMGAVAQIAGAYLVKQLAARQVEALEPSPYFEVSTVKVHAGRLQPSELPQSPFFAWRNPTGGRDLLVLVAEQQPEHGAYAYARALLDLAARYGVERVFTFAAMASPIQPGAEPRVVATATTDALVAELKQGGLELLADGEIGGLNGVFLAAAAARGLPGACLLGEFPFFASHLPNPRASAAVLRAFEKLAGITLDTDQLVHDAEAIETALREHLERVQRAVAAEQAAENAAGAAQEPAGEPSLDLPAPETERSEPEVPPEQVARIEQLFRQARADRSKALELKHELDRRGLFRRYEDRFLDLFRKAG